MKKILKHELAYKRLKEMIAEKRLNPGEKLVEEELAETLEISRTPLRKALALLAQEGLVEITPNAGARIRAVNNHEIMMSLEVIEGVDGMCAYLVAEKCNNNELSDEDKAYLADCIYNMNRVYKMRSEYIKKETYHAEWMFYDRKFHNKIAELCGNSMLLAEYNHLKEIQGQTAWFISVYFVDRKEANEMHDDLYKAIIEGNCERARIIAQKHRHRVRNKTKEILKITENGGKFN